MSTSVNNAEYERRYPCESQEIENVQIAQPFNIRGLCRNGAYRPLLLVYEQRKIRYVVVGQADVFKIRMVFRCAP